jgi:hypothetical protein
MSLSLSTPDWSEAHWDAVPALKNLAKLSSSSRADIEAAVGLQRLRTWLDSPEKGAPMSLGAIDELCADLSDSAKTIQPVESTPPCRGGRFIVERVPTALLMQRSLALLSPGALRSNADLLEVARAVARYHANDPEVQHHVLSHSDLFGDCLRCVPREVAMDPQFPNRTFQDSDIVAYDKHALLPDRVAPRSMHDEGGPTWQQRYLDEKSSIDTPDGFTSYRRDLVEAMAAAISVESRLQVVSYDEPRRTLYQERPMAVAARKNPM